MKKILDLISEQVTAAFVQAGYEEKYGKVTVSNRPDLCEYQCNGALAAAKQYHKAPIMIARDVAAILETEDMFSQVDAVAPGFLNLKVKEAFVGDYLNEMRGSEKFGLETGAPSQDHHDRTTAAPTWQNRCMWDICVLPSSARASSGWAVMWAIR